MKRLLYFLIGFSLVSLPNPHLYASTCADSSGTFTPPSNYPLYYDNYIFLGVYTDGTCKDKDGHTWQEAVGEYITANPSTPGWSPYYTATFTQGGQNFTVNLKQTTKSGVKNTIVYIVIATPCNGSCGLPITDTDGDGTPDSKDLTPNDSTPYTGRLSKSITDSTGKLVWYVVELSDGSLHEFGTIPASPDGYIYKSFDGNPSMSQSDITTAITNSGLEKNYSHNLVEIGTNGQLIEDDLGKWISSYKPPDPITGGPSNMTPTDKPQVGDADNKLLRDISNNTSKGLDNDKIISGQLKEINANIVKGNQQGPPIVNVKAPIVNVNPTLNLDPLLNQNTQNRSADNSEAQGHQSTAESWNPQSNYPESTFNGNLTEGSNGDYKKPGDLSSESWFTSFMSSNPLVTALHNSGFQSYGSVCDVTINLGTLGIHHLSLCEFQPEFAAAGNLLFAFCGLTSLIIVVRG